MSVLTVKILAKGKTLGDVIDAIETVSSSIEGGNVTGFDGNGDGGYVFFVSGDEDPSSTVHVDHRSLEGDDAQGVIAKATVCESSGTRIHALGPNSNCQFCGKPLVLAAG